MKLEKDAFSHEYQVDYFNVDDKLTIRPSHILNYLQSVAVLHSDAVGYDLNFFKRENLGWVLLFWHIQIKRAPVEGEQLKISTWSTDYKRAQANRDYLIEDINGKELCYGASRWVLIDTKKRRPTKPTEGFFDPYRFPDTRDFRNEDFEMPNFSNNSPCFSKTVSVTRRDTDTNGHTNNAVYLDWLIDNIPDEEYSSRSIKDIKISYKKEARRGAIVLGSYFIETLEDKTLRFSGIFSDKENPSVVFSKVSTLWE